MRRQQLTQGQYQRLFVFRTAMRHYLHWSAEQTRAAGLTPQQHQLLLAVRAYGGRPGPSIGDIAASLVLKHHSAVELVDRAEALRLVRRAADRRDRRIVRVRLTRKGARLVARLTESHLEELRRIVPAFESVQHDLAADPGDTAGGPVDVASDLSAAAGPDVPAQPRRRGPALAPAPRPEIPS